MASQHLSHGIGTVLKPIFTNVSWPLLVPTATILVFIVRKAIKKSLLILWLQLCFLFALVVDCLATQRFRWL